MVLYSHARLSDPAIMPEYVAHVTEIHARNLVCAELDPELPKWEEIRNRLKANKWDVGSDMQAYARPTGNERSMIFRGDPEVGNSTYSREGRVGRCEEEVHSTPEKRTWRDD